MMKTINLCLATLAVSLLAMALSPRAAGAADGFSFNDTAGDHLDILLDGKIAGRYMYAFDKAKIAETYKPFCHVFDAAGAAPITKGPGGTLTHHRGIFIGWNKISFNGKSYDRWHMKGGQIVHQKFAEQKADADSATFTSITQWNDEAGKPFIQEERTMTFRRGPAGARLMIDFTSKLTACAGDIALDGDPEHAGIHFRPAEEISKDKTFYFLPKAGADAHKDLDYPWAGETYVLKDQKYSIVELNHPENPKNTHYSAYRDYGRFGAFFKAAIKANESLTVKYRFIIADGDMLPADAIQKCWDQFAGVSSPSPVPQTTLKQAEGWGATAPKKGATPAKKPAQAKPAESK